MTAVEPRHCSRCKSQTTVPNSTYCRECRNAWAREYRAAGRVNHNSVKNRARQRKFRYGLDQAAYDALLQAQGGLCAICREPERVGIGPTERLGLAVDHDRRCCPGNKTCGECVRGLLCFTCNTSLGGFGDDIGRLLDAVAYLVARTTVTSNA